MLRELCELKLQDYINYTKKLLDQGSYREAIGGIKGRVLN